MGSELREVLTALGSPWASFFCELNCVLSPLFTCSVAKLCPSLGNFMDCSTPARQATPSLHYLPEFAQIHVC